MTTVSAGSNATINLAFGQSLSVYCGGGNFFDLTTSPVAGVTRTRSYGPLQTRHTVAPMPLGGTVVINCTFGAVNYDLIGGSGNGLTASISPSGSQAIGTVFTCTPDANFVGTPSYQWKLDGANVGTNSSTYTSTAAGVVTCVVTGHQITASGATVVSSGSSLVANAPFVLVGDSETKYGHTLQTYGNTLTFDRDTNGLVTVTRGSAHSMVGHFLASWANIDTQPDLEGVYETYVTSTTQWQYQTAVVGSVVTGVVGTAASTVLAKLNRFSQTGYWPKFNSAFGGGLKFVGNFGQPSKRTDQFTTQVSLACAALAAYPSGQKFAIFAPGVNDVLNGASAATIGTRTAAHLATFKAAGVKVLLLTPPPFDGTTSTAPRQAVLDAIPAVFAAFETADPAWVKCCNSYAAMVSATPGLAAANMINTNDVHLAALGSRKNVDALVPKAQAWIATSAILPTASGQAPTFTDGQGKVFQLIKDWTSWDGATTAATGTGSSGSVPLVNGAGNSVISGNASLTFTHSVVARSDGVAGYLHRMVVDPSVAAATSNLYAQSFSALSLASLGLSAAATNTTPWALGTADEVLMTYEAVRVQNQNGAKCISVGAWLRDQAGGGLLDLSVGRPADITSPTFGGDNFADPDYSTIMVTGSQVIPPGVTGIFSGLEFKFNGSGGTAMTVDGGRWHLWKRIA